MYSSILLYGLVALRSAWASPSSPSSNDRVIKTVHQFPNETWVENLAVRSKGHILATLVTSPEVWQINPKTQEAHLVTCFHMLQLLLGSLDFGLISLQSLYSVWKVDMSSGRHAEVSKITDIGEAAFLNGLCVIPDRPDTVLIADSDKGVIYQVNIETKAHSNWLDDPAFKPNTTALARLGINGIHTHNRYLYFTNSFLRSAIGRVPIDRSGQPAGPVERIIDEWPWLTNIGFLGDDFTFDDTGNIWVTDDPSNLLVKVNPAKKTSRIVAGGLNDPTLAGDTSAAFGRTPNDRHVLYITTNGGIAYPGKTGIEGGKIAALDTSRLRWHGE